MVVSSQPSTRVSCHFKLTGMDRILYSPAPAWPNGTFNQTEEETAELVLFKDGITTMEQATDAVDHLSQLANGYRLYLMKWMRRPIALSSPRVFLPDLPPGDAISFVDTVGLRDFIESTTNPKAPPPELPLIHQRAERWLLTLAETASFSGFPEESLRRWFLLIEELLPLHESALDQADQMKIQPLRWLRHFASHSELTQPSAVAFITSELPSAVVPCSNGLVVRLDRSSVEHRNLFGRWGTHAQRIAQKLVDDAIASLP